MTDWSMWNWNITSQETQSKRNASVWSKLPQQIKMLTFWQNHSLEYNTGITQIRCWIEQCCRWDVLWMRSWCCCGRKLSSRNSLFTQKQHDNIQVQCKIKSKLTKITARAHMSNKIVNPISVQIGQDCYVFFWHGGNVTPQECNPTSPSHSRGANCMRKLAQTWFFIKIYFVSKWDFGFS